MVHISLFIAIFNVTMTQRQCHYGVKPVLLNCCHILHELGNILDREAHIVM